MQFSTEDLPNGIFYIQITIADHASETQKINVLH